MGIVTGAVATRPAEPSSGSASVLGPRVRSVPADRLLELLDSLAELVARGHDAWRLDVVWSGPAMPWYAALCRRRCAELGLEQRTRFLAGADLDAAGGTAPTPGDERLVVLLEPMPDRRERPREQAEEQPRESVGLADAPVVAETRCAEPRALPPVDETARGARLGTHRRAAAAYDALDPATDPYRRRLVDAVA